MHNYLINREGDAIEEEFFHKATPICTQFPRYDMPKTFTGRHINVLGVEY
jgi:hypothetical protein